MEGHWESNHSHVCYVDSMTEMVCADKDPCSMKGMLLPLFFEDSWPVWARIVLYLTGIIYSFLGIFMVADGRIKYSSLEFNHSIVSPASVHVCHRLHHLQN